MKRLLTQTIIALSANAIIMAPVLVGVASGAEKPACELSSCIDVLHEFADPALAYAAPVIDGNGALYGTTRRGGKYGRGILYRAQSGNFQILHHFQTGSVDGESPAGNLVVDTDGNLYGTADPMIYRYDPPSGYRIIKTLSGSDGGAPFSGLIRDAAGNLYGTNQHGGDPSCPDCGTVYKVDGRCAGVSDWSSDPFCSASGFSVIHRFAGTDGYQPATALTRSGDDLLGTTPTSIFKLSSAGFATLRGYGGDAYNYSALVKDPNSKWFYGVSAPGVIFRIDEEGNFEIVYRFTGGAAGTRPNSALLLDAGAGKLYGTTLGSSSESGAAINDGENNGTVYEYDLRLGTVRTLYTFRLCDSGQFGNKPVGGLTRDAAGNLYGVTAFGGALGNGVLYRINARCISE